MTAPDTDAAPMFERLADLLDGARPKSGRAFALEQAKRSWVTPRRFR